MTRPFDRTLLAVGLAVLVFGASFGVLARTAGLSSVQAIAMSLIVFAGSSQFAAVAALAGGASTAAAALGGLALNLRLLPMGLVIGPWLSGGLVRRAAAAPLVVDESLALAGRPDGSIDERRFLVSGAVLVPSWVAGTAIGALGGGLLGDPRTLGLDAAFPALFLALIAPRLRTESRARRAATAGALLAAAGVVALPEGLAPVLAVAGAAAGGLGPGPRAQAAGGPPEEPR